MIHRRKSACDVIGLECDRRSTRLMRMRLKLPVIISGLVLFVASCSNSRLVDSERVLSPGSHQHGSIFESDLLIPAGSSLDVSYSAESRFYVAKGGRLTGFQKGIRGSRIIAEKGAELPDPRVLKGVKVVFVKSASESYRKRFDPLPPLKSRSFISGGSSSSNQDDEKDDDYHSEWRRSPSSVTPSSYQKKN